jgi:hypothetical protein
MSDEIFEVMTSFADVAELGQGYIDRADGERILLALPRATREGEGVRFIIVLADGTPAFAGAGRCAQVSDQGAEVDAQGRYETLLDSLAFDERSRPVYEYIVAVRQMAYADAEGAAGGEAGVVEEAVYETDASISGWPEASPTEPMSQPPDSLAPTREVETLEPALSEPALSEPALSEPALSEPPSQMAGPTTDPSPAPPATEPPPRPDFSYAVLASVLPEPLPTGMLTRPAIAAHWQPVAPRPPRPSSRPSRFRYPIGTLPMPSAPPRPDLDESQWVRPAPSPASGG